MTWSWSRPGEEILEQWSAAITGAAAHTQKITLGAQPGQLTLWSSALGGGMWDGAIQPDGGVLFIGRGILRVDHHVGLAADGLLETRRAVIKKGQLSSLVEANKYARFALVDASPASSMTVSNAAGATGTSVRAVAERSTAPVDPHADPAIWGDYARMVGRDWRGYYDVSVQWSVPGSEIIEVWKYGPMSPISEGQIRRTLLIRPGKKPGRLEATMSGGGKSESLNGKINKAGHVSFGEYTVKLIDANTAEYWASFIPGYYSQRGYAASSALSAEPQRSTWGTYLDLAGQSFRGEGSSGRLLLSFGWLIPGEVLYELRHYLDHDLLYGEFIHVSPEDGALIARSAPPWNVDARGTVDTNGKVSFVTKRTLGMRAENSRELRTSGQLEFKEKGSLQSAATWMLSEVALDQVPQIRMAAQREKQQRDRAEAVAKAERSQQRAEFFGNVVGAMGTVSQELSMAASASGGSTDAQLGEATGRALDQLRVQHQQAAITREFSDSADSSPSYSSSSSAGAAAFVDGVYALEGGSYSIDAKREGSELVVTEPNKVARYQSHSDGVWHFYNPNNDTVYGLRVIDERTLEAFKPQSNAAPTRLNRVGGASASVAQLKATNEATNVIAERYKQKATVDPDNVQVWSACALAAHKRAVSPGPAADLYGMQMAQMLKQLMTDSSTTPCADAIPAEFW